MCAGVGVEEFGGGGVRGVWPGRVEEKFGGWGDLCGQASRPARAQSVNRNFFTVQPSTAGLCKEWAAAPAILPVE